MATTEQEQMTFWQKESHSAITHMLLQLDEIARNIKDEKYTYATLSRLLPDLETMSENLGRYQK